MEQEADSTVISLIKDLQKQVTYLEKKIDMLVAQFAGRPTEGRNFSQAPHNYGQHKRYENPRGGGYGSKYGSKHTPSGHSYEKDAPEDGERYTPKKRPFRPGDKDRSSKTRKRNFPGSFNKNR